MNLKVTLEGEAADIMTALSKAFDTHVAAPADIVATEAPAPAGVLAEVPTAADTFVQTVEATTAAPEVQAAVDSEGVPWDERIHSGNKGLTAKGIWQKRRNLAAGYYEQITAELKGETAAPTPPPPLAAGYGEQAAATPPPPAPATATPPPPATEQAVAPTDFGQLVNAITANQITQEAIAAACASMDVANVGAIARTPERIPEFWGLVK